MDALIFKNGKDLRDKAQRHAALLEFMIQHAGPEAWGAMADLTPGAGPWVLGMNQRRVKRTATPVEAATIIRLLQARYSDLNSCADEIVHGLRDPVWLLFNLRQMGDPDVSGEL
jgi:hypothetical protein